MTTPGEGASEPPIPDLGWTAGVVRLFLGSNLSALFLIFATIATLIFVPVVFSVIHRKHGKAAKAAPAGEHGVLHVV